MAKIDGGANVLPADGIVSFIRIIWGWFLSLDSPKLLFEGPYWGMGHTGET